MAQNISLLGASYSDVPAVVLPKTGGGTARFDDASVTTATAADVASGKTFLAADGTITTGTSSGGGGSSPWTHIITQEVAVTTTETSAKTAATIQCGSAIYTKDRIVWVHIRDKAGKRAGYFYGSDAFYVNTYCGSGSTNTFSVPAVLCIRYTTSSAFACTAGQYGVYPYSISITGGLNIRRRYNSTNTLTIDGTYVVDVYTLDLPSGLTLFD